MGEITAYNLFEICKPTKHADVDVIQELRQSLIVVSVAFVSNAAVVGFIFGSIGNMIAWGHAVLAASEICKT